jgi:hypothetical protein
MLSLLAEAVAGLIVARAFVTEAVGAAVVAAG